MKFSKTHEWVALDEEKGRARIGISKKALEELGEIVFVSLPQVGSVLSPEEPMAVVESTKAAIDIYAPIAGKVSGINKALSENIDLLNQDPQGQGWLCEVEVESPMKDEHLMSAACYDEL